jgi:Tfp pilus assembly protein PilF
LLLGCLLGAALVALVVTAPYRARLVRETAALARRREAAMRLQAEAADRDARRRERLAWLAGEVDRSPSAPAVQLRAGLEYLDLGEAQKAVRVLGAAARARPGDAAVRAALGQAYEATRRLDRALNEYRAARRLAPGDVAHDLRLATLLSRLAWRREALRVLQDAVARAPRHAGARIALALLLFQTGDLAAAEAQLRVARSLDPTNPVVPGLLADIFVSAGRFPEARAALEAALAARPDDPDLLALQAEVAQGLGHSALAEQAARAALARQPRDARARVVLVRALQARGLSAEALAALEPLLHTPAATEASLLLAAGLARRLGRAEQARVWQRRFVQRQAARRDLERLSYRAELQPADPGLRLQLGRVYLVAGDAPRAVVELRRSLELRPGWEPARRALAEARRKAGE